jgi:hypothetical protein
MSRSGYSDDVEDQWALICWRGAVASALRGKRGQAVLREALGALDALPKAELVAGDLEAAGSVCLLGAVGKRRNLDMTGVDVEDHEHVASLFALPHALACEIMWENDEGGRYGETPRARWERMRRWVSSNIKGDLPGGVGQSEAEAGPSEDSQSPKPDRMERSAISPSSPPPTIRPDTGDA